MIAADGGQAGIVKLSEALSHAKEAGLDLVEISPNTEPPVCKVMDFGRYRFDLNKKKMAQKKKQRRTQLKEVKFRPATDSGDFNRKIKDITDFIEQGDKVKVTLRYRGREMMHHELGADMMLKIKESLTGVCQIEQEPKLEGRQMVMMLSPLRKEAQKKNQGT